MKIHSSSLRTPPAKLVGTPIDKLARAQNNVTREETKTNLKQDVVKVTQTPAEIEQLLTQEGLELSNEPVMKDVLNDPLPTKVKQALNAYDDQRNQAIQNQREELIVGIDFYV
ncbi:MAG: hypothetical protein ABL903_13595 [Methylococcales bacterium]